jgi:hypothetical protein
MESFKKINEKKLEISDPLASMFSFKLESLSKTDENTSSPSAQPLNEENMKKEQSKVVIIDENPREVEFYKFYFSNSQFLFFKDVNIALKRITAKGVNQNIAHVVIDDSISDIPAPIIVSLIKKFASDLKKEIIIVVSYKKQIDLKRYNPKPNVVIEKDTGHMEVLEV